MLFGCKSSKNKDYEAKYYDLIDLVSNRDEFSSNSKFFESSIEVLPMSDGTFRYYITIDKPLVAMYEIEAIAIEKGVDYTSQMAANVGVFDNNSYTMIPNQVDPDKGFYQGITISGISENEKPTVYVLIDWKNQDLSDSTKEYLKFTIE